MATKSKWHDANGKFVKGNQAAVGHGRPPNPPAELPESHLSTLLETVTPEDWQAMVAAQMKRARAGNARAFELLARYVLASGDTRYVGESKAIITVESVKNEPGLWWLGHGDDAVKVTEGLLDSLKKRGIMVVQIIHGEGGLRSSVDVPDPRKHAKEEPPQAVPTHARGHTILATDKDTSLGGVEMQHPDGSVLEWNQEPDWQALQASDDAVPAPQAAATDVQESVPPETPETPPEDAPEPPAFSTRPEDQPQPEDTDGGAFGSTNGKHDGWAKRFT